MMEVILNGTPHKTPALTVADLARELSPAPQCLLFELNEVALCPSDWENCPLKPGDKLEVLKVSAGG